MFLFTHLFRYKFTYLCIAVFCFWTGFNFLYPRIMTNGDPSAILVYANLLYNDFSFLNRDWYYPTELRFFHPAFFYLPFFPFIDTWSLIRAAAIVVMFIVLFICMVYTLKQYDVDKDYYGLAMLLFFMPISNHYLYVSIISSFYPIYYSIILLYLALIIRIGSATTPPLSTRIYWLIYLVVCFYSCLNGIKMLLFFIPIFIAACCLFVWYFITKNPNFYITKKITVISFVGFIFCTLGYLINDVYLRKLVKFVNYTDRGLDFSFSMKKIENLWFCFKFSFSIHKWDSYISIISNICLFIIILSFLYFMYIIFKSGKYPTYRLVVLSFIFALLEQVAVAYLTPYFKSKYVYLAAVYAPIIVCIYLKLSKSRINKIIFIIFMSALIIHSTVVTVYAFSREAHKKQDYFIYWTYYDEYLENIIKYLEDNNYIFGYGNYHEAHGITEMTNGKIEGAPIKFHKCKILAMQWDSLVRYYRYDNHRGKVFLMIPENFYNRCKDINPLIKGKEFIFKDNNQLLFDFENKDILDYFSNSK